MSEKFAVEIAPNQHTTLPHSLSVTHNGYQWTTIHFDADELPLLIDAVSRYLDDLRTSGNPSTAETASSNDQQ